MRLRGMGSVRKRPRGGYQIRYRWRGQMIEESVGRTLGKATAFVTEKDATGLLKTRLREIERGQFAGAERDQLTVTEALDNYLKDLRLRRRIKGERGTIAVMRRLSGAFGEQRLSQITSRGLRAWADRWLTEGSANATVRQRLAVLHSALKLAHREEQLAALPAFPRITVDNARQVFFTRPEFEAVHTKLVAINADVADVALFAYLTGWRKGEVIGLEWAWVDRGQRLIRLPDSKNGDGRVLPLVGELGDVIDRRWKARALGVPHVFHRGGKRIKRFERPWRKACGQAELAGRWFHDFRRSAARDLVEAGSDYKEAMAVTGHKSAQVFMRYRIVDSRASARALTRMQAHRANVVTAVVNEA